MKHGMLAFLIYISPAFVNTVNAESGGIASTVCQFLLSAVSGRIEHLYPHLAGMSDQDFLDEVWSIIEYRTGWPPENWFGTGKYRSRLPFRVVKAIQPRARSTFRRINLKTTLECVSQKTARPVSPVDPSNQPSAGERLSKNYLIFRMGSKSPVGLIRLWTESSDELFGYRYVRVLYEFLPNGCVRETDSEEREYAVGFA